MPNMDVWSWGLLAFACFVAITTLARLMTQRRDQILAELTAKAEAEQREKRLAEQREKKKTKAAA